MSKTKTVEVRNSTGQYYSIHKYRLSKGYGKVICTGWPCYSLVVRHRQLLLASIWRRRLQNDLQVKHSTYAHAHYQQKLTYPTKLLRLIQLLYLLDRNAVEKCALFRYFLRSAHVETYMFLVIFWNGHLVSG